MSQAFSLYSELSVRQNLVLHARLFLVPEAEINFLSLERSQSHLIMACKYDMSRIEEELGFHTKWTMKEGIKETINLVRQEKGLKTV